MSKPHLQGEVNGRSKLSQEQVLKIRESSSTAVVLAKQYEVSANTIGKIRRGETWKHLNISNH